jgi:hypothetical protein
MIFCCYTMSMILICYNGCAGAQQSGGRQHLCETCQINRSCAVVSFSELSCLATLSKTIMPWLGRSQAIWRQMFFVKCVSVHTPGCAVVKFSMPSCLAILSKMIATTV